MALRFRNDTGALPEGFPYARVGSGPRTLVVLPGFEDSMFSGSYPPGAGWLLTPYFGRYLSEYTVYLLSRPRGLPADYDAEAAVESHARALESILESREEDTSRETGALEDADAAEKAGSAADGGVEAASGADGADVIGISMGGMIAQELARRRPDLVRRLVIANSAHELAEEARPEVRRFEKYAREGDWQSIRAELAKALYSDARAIAYPPLIRTVGRLALPRPAEPADVWRSLEFVLGFDAGPRLEEIDTRTLVFGGERDPYFPPRLTRETAAGIPDADLTLVPGKHGAYHERKWRFDSRVLSFLDAEA